MNCSMLHPNRIRWLALAALFVLGGPSVVVLATEPPGHDVDHPAIRVSARIVVWLWPWAAALPFVGRSIALRWVHTLGAALCVLHVAVAFHLGHGWSHAAAFEHTERVAGFGPGVFVNDFFVALWIAESLAAWLDFDRYLKRPRWLRVAIVSFMGFIVLNAGVVFASGPWRWVALAAFVLPWFVLRRRAR